MLLFLKSKCCEFGYNFLRKIDIQKLHDVFQSIVFFLILNLNLLSYPITIVNFLVAFILSINWTVSFILLYIYTIKWHYIYIYIYIYIYHLLRLHRCKHFKLLILFFHIGYIYSSKVLINKQKILIYILTKIFEVICNTLIVTMSTKMFCYFSIVFLGNICFSILIDINSFWLISVLESI